MNIYLLSSNDVNIYKKFKLHEGNLYMDEKRTGIETFKGNQVNIIDHSFNLSDNIDISNLYIENNLLIDICNSFNNNKNFINGDLDVCGEINMNNYVSSNDNFSGEAYFDSIKLKNIYRYSIDDNTLSFNNMDASNTHFHSNLIIIESKIESNNIITNNLDICNNIYSNKLNIYKKLDISDNLDICGNVHILKNMNISNDFSTYNGNLHINKNMTIHNDISINNYNIKVNIIDVCGELHVSAFQTDNKTLTENQFIPVASILTISTFRNEQDYSKNDTITISCECIDASQTNLLIKDISCIYINVSGDAQFGNLIVDGSFSFNSIIENINSINNEILIMTQLDISNIGSGIALEITQGGNGDDNDVLHITSKSENIVLKINSSGNIIFYKDLTIHGDLDICNNLIIGHNLDVCGNVDISNDLIVDGNVDICDNLDISESLNIDGNLDISGSLNINEITIIEKDKIHFIQGDISNTGSYYGYGTVPIGGIIMWSGTEIPYGWTFCDGTNDKPNLSGRFIMSSTYSNENITIGQEDGSYNIQQTGGKQYVILEDEEMPSHNHSIDVTVDLIHKHTNDKSVNTNISTNAVELNHNHNWDDEFAEKTGPSNEQNDTNDIRDIRGGGNRNEGTWDDEGDNNTGNSGAHLHQVNIQHIHNIKAANITHSHNCGDAGNEGSHENLPPYYVLAFIMRIS